MSDLNTALRLAMEDHAGQTDKSGDPYLLHLLRVMLSQRTDAQRKAAVLHDWEEDAGGTAEKLRARGFDEETIADIEALTKRDGESREGAAHRAAARPVSLAVKIGDNKDNRNLDRLPTITEDDLKRHAQYERVREILSDACTQMLQAQPELAAELPLDGLLQPTRFDLPGYGEDHTIHVKRLTHGARAPFYVVVNEARALLCPGDGLWEFLPPRTEEGAIDAFFDRCSLPTLHAAAAAALMAVQTQRQLRQERFEQRQRALKQMTD